MWETMGPIADRSRERLGASDVAIVQFRRIMVDAARKLRDGGPAIGTAPQRIAARQAALVRGHRAEDDATGPRSASPRRNSRCASAAPAHWRAAIDARLRGRPTRLTAH